MVDLVHGLFHGWTEHWCRICILLLSLLVLKPLTSKTNKAQKQAGAHLDQIQFQLGLGFTFLYIYTIYLYHPIHN